MKQIELPGGERVSCLGMGTWRMGDEPAAREQELAALRLGLDMGASLIDTAEMYGSGKAEALVGEAMAGRRDAVFLVDKVLPSNASRSGTIKACERSLRFLKTDHIDLYLLHWPGDAPFAETLAAFRELQETGKIRYYGVSNLNLEEMKEWWSLQGGDQVQTDQVLYNLMRRGIEWDLLPWLRERRVPVMAYSPLEEGRLVHDRRLIALARSHGMTAAQAALGWLLAREGVIVIPKSGDPKRVKENIEAAQRPLATSQVRQLEELFPGPNGPAPLEML